MLPDRKLSTSGHTAISIPSSYYICPECNRKDSRGVHWNAKYGFWAIKNCPEGKGNGSSLWFCDGALGDFNTTEPDRSSCVEEWIFDTESMVDDDTITAYDISVVIKNNSQNEKDMIGGGGILQLPTLFDKVLDKRRNEYNETLESNEKFTSNLYFTGNIVFSSDVGWQEIPDASSKDLAITQYLKDFDHTGYLWLTKINAKTASECGQEHVFNHSRLNYTVRTAENYRNSEECFYFGDVGEICVPNNAFQEQKDCNVFVASRVDTRALFDPGESYIFPNEAEGYGAENSRLGLPVLGVTVNNRPQQLPAVNPARISFYHKKIYEELDGCLLVPRPSGCIFWDVENNSWSSTGCQLELDSDADHTVCTCDHLTNFGIFLDWEGTAPDHDPELSLISTICLSISCACLFATEASLQFCKKDKVNRTKLRRHGERSRNIALFIAQILWMALPDQFVSVSCTICQVFGGLTHYAYLVFFSWTVIEAYLFYSAIIIVLSHQIRFVTLNLFSYGIPAIIVGIVVVTSEMTGSKLYLRRNSDGRVQSCWLEGNGMLALLVPVGITILLSSIVTFLTIKVTQRAQQTRHISLRRRTITTARNSLLISLLLGLTWTVGFLPVSTVQQYLMVVLNASMGVYIFLFSVLFNKQVREDLMSRFSRKPSSVATGNTMLSARQNSISDRNVIIYIAELWKTTTDKYEC